MLAIGNYYSYDIPAALHTQLQDLMTNDEKHDFETYFNLLYTCYSIPNVILPLFGGRFVDRIGPASCILFSSLVLIGQIVFSFGAMYKNWPIMLLGRAIYGLGGENMGVANSCLIAKWFAGSELALSFGVTMSIARLGSVINNIVSPKMANAEGTSSACWLGAILNFLSVIMSIYIWMVEKRVSRQIYNQQQSGYYCRTVVTSSNSSLAASFLEEDNLSGYYAMTDNDDVSLPDDLRYDEDQSIHSSSFYNNNNNNRIGGSGSGGTKHNFSSSKSVASMTSSSDNSSNDASSSVKLSHILKFGRVFWLLCASCFVVYGIILPFNNVASGILLERDYFVDPSEDCVLRYVDQCTAGTLAPEDGNPSSCDGDLSSNTAPVLPKSLNFTQENNADVWDSDWEKSSYVYDDLKSSNVNCEDSFWADACTKDYCDSKSDASEKAGQVMSIPYFISASLSPFLGGLVDKVGRRAIMATFAPLLLVAAHLVFGYSDWTPIIPLVGQGMAYVIFSAVIWPSVPLTVESKYTGTAYGVMTSIQNIGLAIFPLIIASIHNSGGKSYIPSVELFFVCLAAFGVAVGTVLHVVDQKTGARLHRVENSDGSTLDSMHMHDGGFECNEVSALVNSNADCGAI